MIVDYLVYDPTNGQILSSGICSEEFVQMQGKHVLIGKCDQLTQYVRNGKLENLPEKPEGFHWKFDFQSHQWVRDLQMLSHQAKLQRANLLSGSDWTQLPDVPIQTKQAWAEYRQALRDIPQQSNFPENIVWPQAPN